MTSQSEANDFEIRSQTATTTRPRTDSVEAAIDQIGDRWTFLILRESFFGVRRFDQFQEHTGISPAVLADRLRRLVQDALLIKRRYSSHANRFEYLLTEKGHDLYPLIVLAMQWGDRWLNADNPPIQLTHDCGATGPFELTCGNCAKPVSSRDTTWSPTGSRG